MMKSTIGILIGCSLWMASCENKSAEVKPTASAQDTIASQLIQPDSLTVYTKVRLTTDVSLLNDEEKQVLKLMIEAASIMDVIFWDEAIGKGRKETFLSGIKDTIARQFALINYGPWDRLNGNTPFLKGAEPKPAGAGFYPADITKEEFEAWTHPLKTNPYTMVVRKSDGQLDAVWYHDVFADRIQKASTLLTNASEITTDPELKFYLQSRAEALTSDSYNSSDVAWLGMKNNHLDIIIGPIENYEDQLLGIRTSHESYVLVKDKEWSAKLDRYAALLPQLQTQLPVDAAYKKDKVGSSSQLAAFDVVYYAGDCNAGSKTIAVNLPNDETIQQEHGTRRSQLKNAMRAKYDKILVPIADELIADEQRANITFEAFFGNVMFHEVAHGLGIKNTLKGGRKVSEALGEQHAWLEEAKADVLGLWLVTKLFEMGEIKEGQVMDNYVTFLASIFRSCRFGVSSAHGKANMMTFNFLQSLGAFERDATTGKYKINLEKMKVAIDLLAGDILKLQGEGSIETVAARQAETAVIGEALKTDIAKLNSAGIPTDVVFEQGTTVLGL
jgi:hypothetical protein